MVHQFHLEHGLTLNWNNIIILLYKEQTYCMLSILINSIHKPSQTDKEYIKIKEREWHLPDSCL